MKKLLSTLFILSLLVLVGCSSEQPMTEEQQAESYGMTVERYREEKAAAARMGMTWEEHVKMIQDGDMDHGGMDHGDMEM